jgi:hypothetical protein
MEQSHQCRYQYHCYMPLATESSTRELTMNIDRNYVGRVIANASPLDGMYEPVQHWRELLGAARAGRAEFTETL